ncbi:MAG: hypothetical protein ACRDSH_05690 [Pseudonocardiaceae bacterium]
MVAGRDRIGWWRRRTATREADFWDGVVDAQLKFVSQLPPYRREELVEALAFLVMLAQDHRHYGQGWISRDELQVRVERTLAGLDALGEVSGRVTAAVNRAD